MAADSEYRFAPVRPRVAKPPRSRRARRAFARYLVAICIGVAGTLAWQSYGDTVKQTVATKAPALGWSPEVQQLIVALIQQVGWDKPAALESGAPQTAQQAPAAQTAFDPAAYKPSASPSPTSEQVQQMASDLVILKQAVGQLASNQDQMAQDIAKVQATGQEVLNKVSANRVAAPAPRTASMPVSRHPPGSSTPSEPPPAQPLPSR